MVDKLNQIQQSGTDSKLNTYPAKLAIQAKMKAEDAGILSKTAFASPIAKETYSKSDKKLMAKELKQLEQEGYGLPGSQLKTKLLKKIKREKMKKTLSGRGNQSGIKVHVLDAVKQLGKHLKINVPVKKVGRIIDYAVANSPNQVKQIANASRAVVSVISHLTGIKPPTSVKNKLLLDLSKHIVSRVKGGQAGGSFFSGFIDGFKAVFKPAAKVIGAVATAVGVPEVGVPLGVVGSLL